MMGTCLRKGLRKRRGRQLLCHPRARRAMKTTMMTTTVRATATEVEGDIA
jgi:hypothetical protein